MKVNTKRIIEGATAIAIWILPWVIVASIIIFYRESINVEPFLKNGSVYIIGMTSVFYVISSITSFIGFLFPIFSRKDLSTLNNIKRPQCVNQYSSHGTLLLERVTEDNTLLFASLITIRDFLYQQYETSKRYELAEFIPSMSQMKNYPIESLCMMLSAQKRVEYLDADKYYNFDLIIRTCTPKPNN